MKLEQQFTVPYPRAQVWEYFGDVAEVTSCMPGASLTQPPEGKRVKFQLRVKLGPIAAAFTGEADYERDDTTHRGVLRGSGRDTRSGSRASGEVAYTLSEEEEAAATRVAVTVDYSLAGPLAQFGRSGIVNDLAARLTSQFASNLKQRLAASAATTPSAEPPTEEDGLGDADASKSTTRPAAELHAGSLLVSVLWNRVKRLLAMLFGTR